MSTPYEVSLSNGMLLTFDRTVGGLQVVMRPYPSDEVLLSENTPAPFYGVMSWNDVGLLTHWLDVEKGAYGS